MNILYDSPLAIRRFCVIKKTLLGNLLHHMNIMLQGKELNIREVSMEEIIHWYFHPLHPQAPIALPNQNQTLKKMPLWVVYVSLAYGDPGKMYLDMHHSVAPSPSQICGISLCNFPSFW